MPGRRLPWGGGGSRGGAGSSHDAVEPRGDGAAPGVRGGSSSNGSRGTSQLITHSACSSNSAAAAAARTEGARAATAAAWVSSQHGQQQQRRRSLLGRRGPAATAARQVLTMACVLGLLGAAAGSPGDQSWPFQRCATQCRRTGCASLTTLPATGGTTGSGLPAVPQCSPLCNSSSGGAGSDGSSINGAQQTVPLALRLWRWDCAADCSYLCMWQLEGSWRQAGVAPQKYYGKWPFARLAGMQEPASVLFSLLNLAAHAHCLARFCWLCRGLRAQRGQQAQPGGAIKAPAAGAAADNGAATNGISSNGSAGASSPAAAPAPSPYPYAWLWAGYMLLSINAWLWSAVFHGRDTRFTERFDYFSAALLIFFNLFLSIVRVCRLCSPAALAVLAAPLLLFLASHFRFMLFVLFDYGYHVKVCIAASAAQSLLWLLWALAARPRPPGRRPLLSFILLVNACMALEVLDFPPVLATLDAHSLWHAATAPLIYLFYHFVQADVTGWAEARPKLA
ncbi:hypothetical protein ABPG75_004428 [Micractinium tetrahymenae]